MNRTVTGVPSTLPKPEVPSAVENLRPVYASKFTSLIPHKGCHGRGVGEIFEMYCLNAYPEEVSKIKVSFKLYVIMLGKNLGFHSFLLWIL